MDEFEKLYTVEDVARMTSFTSRTIRNYLKNGTLQGRKIGGQWRFTMENIKQLFKNSGFLGDFSSNNKRQVINFINGIDVGIKGKTQVCTVVDYFCENSKAGQQIYEKLVRVINSRENGSPPVKFFYEFSEKESKARFTLFGDPDYIVQTLQLL